MRVTDIKKSSQNFKDSLKTDKDLKKCIPFIPDGLKAEDLLPRGVKHILDFTLSNTTSAFANAIRITLMEESVVKSLEIKTLNMDDMFIIDSHLAKRIEAIPIKQELEYKNPITLNIVNETRNVLPVMSKDIKIDGKYNNSRFFADTYCITKLGPGKSLKIVMEVVIGDGREDSNKFANISNIRYYPGCKPLDEETGAGKSSLASSPDVFRIGFSTFRNASLKNIIDRVHESLTTRLKYYSQELKLPTMKSRKLTYSSKRLEIRTVWGIYRFRFMGEFRTLPMLICRYCYELYPQIVYISSSIEHRSKEVGYIKIKTPRACETYTVGYKYSTQRFGNL